MNFGLLFSLRFRLIIVLHLFFAVVNLTLVDLPGLTKVAVGNTILLQKVKKKAFLFVPVLPFTSGNLLIC